MSFWSHHALQIQMSRYSPLLLPPYQFEKSRHWMELKKPQKLVAEVLVQQQAPEVPKSLWTFVWYQNERIVRFRVNTMAEKYQRYVSAHVIAQTAPICPSTLQLVIAIDTLVSLVASIGDSSLQRELRGMDSHAPMVLDASRFVWLDAETSDANQLVWDWKMTSSSADGVEPAMTLHVSGRIVFRSADDVEVQNDFERYERLVGRQPCQALLDGNEADGVIQGSRNIYKAFAETCRKVGSSLMMAGDMPLSPHQYGKRQCNQSVMVMLIGLKETAQRRVCSESSLR
jgi:hypothetical protein